MKINQNVVNLINARLQDLKFEVVLVNSLEQLVDEKGYLSATSTLSEHLAMLSNKFGEELTSFDEVKDALSTFEKELDVLVQTDYLVDKFKNFTDLSSNMNEVKNKLLPKAMAVLEINEDEIQTENTGEVNV